MNSSSLKIISLVILTVQTSAFVLTARQSRRPDENGEVYFAGTAVFLMEAIKLVTSAIAILYRAFKISYEKDVRAGDYQILQTSEGAQSEKESQYHLGSCSLQRVLANVFLEVKALLWTSSAFWLVIPAAAYVAQNNLQLIAASNLEPALFQTFTQAKLITTAGFSVLIMKRSLHKYQWLSIVLLGFGLIVVHQASLEKINVSGSETYENISLGFFLMMAASLLSGFAGVFTEKLLKQDKDFWATNFHMSFFSLLPALLVIVSRYLNDFNFQPMRAFGKLAWATVFLNAFGGLICSMVLKFADSIAKGFSLAFAIILTIIINVVIFHTAFSLSCLMGILTVLLSTTLYIYIGASIKAKPQVQYTVEDPKFPPKTFLQ